MHARSTGSWVPVALSQDIPALVVMPVRFAGETIALWRSASGRVTASADRCPHRGMRLSHGFVRGELLSCIYHGWSYAQSGQCMKIPAHPSLKPPETIRVVTYTVREQNAVVWVSDGSLTAEPPRLEGLSPLRSMSANIGIEALEASTGAQADDNGLLEIDGLSLLCHALSADETLILVLMPDDAGMAQRIAASRAAEALRRSAETFTSGAAA